MRKSKVVNKKLGVYARYKVIGLNQDYLINLLYRKGISLFNVKKISSKKMLFSIKLNEIENFFAITNNLCYNIKGVNFHGITLPIYLALKNFGLVLGGLFLAIFCYVSSDFVYDIEFTGSGKILEREISNVLEENGVKKYARFSKIDLSSLSDKILASSENLTFATCSKRGNKMIIELVLSKNANKSTLGRETEIRSEVNGVIEDIKVYRGTPLKEIGEKVDVGEIIVDGTATVKDEIVKVNPIAYISIIVEEQTDFFSLQDGLESVYSATVESENLDKDVVFTQVIKEKKEEGFLYTVNLRYRYVIYK